MKLKIKKLREKFELKNGFSKDHRKLDIYKSEWKKYRKEVTK